MGGRRRWSILIYDSGVSQMGKQYRIVAGRGIGRRIGPVIIVAMMPRIAMLIVPTMIAPARGCQRGPRSRLDRPRTAGDGRSHQDAEGEGAEGNRGRQKYSRVNERILT